MSSPPDFEGNANRSIPSGEFETREPSAPGFETRGNNSMLGNDRGLDQDPYVHAQLPSYKDMRQGQNSLVASGLGTTTEYGSSPDFDDIGHKNISKPGLESHTTSYDEAPGHSANLRQNTSATSTSNTTTPTSANQVDYTGISLIGSRFKAVNPDPYTISRKNEN